MLQPTWFILEGTIIPTLRLMVHEKLNKLLRLLVVPTSCLTYALSVSIAIIVVSSVQIAITEIPATSIFLR